MKNVIALFCLLLVSLPLLAKSNNSTSTGQQLDFRENASLEFLPSGTRIQLTTPVTFQAKQVYGTVSKDCIIYIQGGHEFAQGAILNSLEIMIAGFNAGNMIDDGQTVRYPFSIGSSNKDGVPLVEFECKLENRQATIAVLRSELKAIGAELILPPIETK